MTAAYLIAIAPQALGIVILATVCAARTIRAHRRRAATRDRINALRQETRT